MTRIRPPGTESQQIDMLRSILEKAQNPRELDAHPWATSPIVDQLLAVKPEMAQLGGGQRLLHAIAGIFRQTQPSVPPRQGLRLDTRWCEFGILASRYFAPLEFGVPFPTSMRDAWGRMDEAIQLFVSGGDRSLLSAHELAKYRLVGDEQEVAAESTLSDWHRKGLEHLAAAIQQRQDRLRALDPNPGSNSGAVLKPAKRRRVGVRAVLAVLGALAALTIAFGATRAYRAYMLAQQVRMDLHNFANAMPSEPGTESFIQLSGQLPAVSSDIAALQTAVRPFVWVGPLLRWVPVYGGDLAQAGDLLELAHRLTSSAQKADVALLPLLTMASDQNAAMSLSGIVDQLKQSQPQLADAEREFALARSARQSLRPQDLSPQVRDLLLDTVDPAMGWMDDGLSLSIALPDLLGAGSAGPKTYLLLAQNEDELRPSGGLITAVGKIVVDRGHVVDLSFENSSEVDNWEMPYPMAPWQLRDYMNSRVLVLRDAGWFSDFPTAVLYVRQLYAYGRQGSVDGVIAFDQQMLVMLLDALGPVQVRGVDYPITAGNVVEYMRQSKNPPPTGPEGLPADYDYKAFVGPLAQAVVDRLLSSNAGEWRAVAFVGLEALQQRHLLLEMDAPEFAAVLARRGWNGAVASSSGDYLMVVDTNVGFNKTNAVVETRLDYDVDLSDPSAPESELHVRQINHAAAIVPCIQWTEDTVKEQSHYPIDRCYWDYMRVYVPKGAHLTAATPQTIPDAWMILNRHVEPRVETLDEGLPGLASFGTLLVVPEAQEVATSMHFTLPADTVLVRNLDGSVTYSLTVRKQPGTLAVPITIRVQLPEGASVVSQSPGGARDGQTLVFLEKLQVDQEIKVDFRVR